MPYLTIVDALLAVSCVLWMRALTRARGDEIPCTTRVFSWAIVAVGVITAVGIVVANVLVLIALDPDFGKKLSPIVFAAWLLAMSVAAIVFIIAVHTRDTNRNADAWLRLVPPDGLVVRAGEASKTVRLEPGAVRAFRVFGMYGVPYVQYFIRDGDASLALLVPFTPDAAAATDGAPALDVLSGLLAQGDARKIHKHFGPFCATHAPDGART